MLDFVSAEVIPLYTDVLGQLSPVGAWKRSFYLESGGVLDHNQFESSYSV